VVVVEREKRKEPPCQAKKRKREWKNPREEETQPQRARERGIEKRREKKRHKEAREQRRWKGVGKLRERGRARGGEGGRARGGEGDGDLETEVKTRMQPQRKKRVVVKLGFFRLPSSFSLSAP